MILLAEVLNPELKCLFVYCGFINLIQQLRSISCLLIRLSPSLKKGEFPKCFLPGFFKHSRGYIAKNLMTWENKSSIHCFEVPNGSCYSIGMKNIFLPYQGEFGKKIFYFLFNYVPSSEDETHIFNCKPKKQNPFLKIKYVSIPEKNFRL